MSIVCTAQKNCRDLPSKPAEETGWMYQTPAPPTLQLLRGLQALPPESNGTGGNRDSKDHVACVGLCHY